ncbi:MAG: dihydroorotate dehydrogenase [Planctomycetia bacterium]|nr:dihydroorotate dehydrogenase [Planctomycetia bacterium]
MTDLTCTIRSVKFSNPIFTASGTFGYGDSVPEFVDLSKLGAIITKSITYEPRVGNPPPRVVETPSGMLNSIGLANIGVINFIKDIVPLYEKFDTKIIVNIAGSTNDEYLKVLKEIESVSSDIIGYEINISCPNVEYGGMELGISAELSNKLIAKLRKYTEKLLIVKLTPNVTDISIVAKAVEDAGADAISAINTVVGMGIDIEKRKPTIYKTYAGLSGPAIKPIALAMVHKISAVVSIPIIGIGGIVNGGNVVEFLLAGATAVQIGTANFRNANASIEIVDELNYYLENNSILHYYELIGKLDLYE